MVEKVAPAAYNRIRLLLVAARSELDAARPGGAPGQPYYYLQGYVQALQGVAEGQIESVDADLEDAQHLLAYQQGTLPAGASPRRYTDGRVDALRRVQQLLRQKRGAGDDGPVPP